MDYTPPEKYEHLRADTAYVLPVGEIEFDVVASFLSTGDADLYQTLFEAEYGILPGVLIEIEIPMVRHSPGMGGAATGLGDIEIDSKIRLAERGRFVSALSFSIEAPTGSVEKNLGSGRWGGEIALLTGLKFHQMGVHTALGVEWNADDGFDALFAKSTVDYQPPESALSFQVSANVETDTLGQQWKATLAPGIKYEREIGLFDEVSFALGVPIGLTDISDKWGIRVSFGAEL